METKSGFTLIQLFVVIILCVFWLFVSVLIPQFTTASTSSGRGLTFEDLQAVRSQIELYKIHHNGDLPGTAAGVSFVQALTQRTNADGSLNPTGRRYGPYMRKIPMNRYNGLDTVEINGVLGGGDYGWHFNTTTGEFHADTDKHTRY